MKIAYVINVFPKLSESFILNEIVELLKNGHDVQIYSLIKPMEEVAHEEVEKYQIIEKTSYFSFKHLLKTNYINLSKYFLYGVIQDLNELSKYNLKRNLKLAYFATVMEENGVEFIHTHFASMGNIARRLGKMLRLQYTFTAHAFEIFINPNIKMLKQNIDGAAYVFTPSKYNKQYLIDLTDCDENKIEIIHATIDPAKFSRTEKSDKKQIIMAARLVEKKGMKYMIKAMKDITRRYPDAILKIIGDGPLLNELIQLVMINNLENNVKFLGSISDEEYFNELESSMIAALPCIISENGDRDVCPLTLQEAMSMEVPVISTNVHSVPELIDDGITGILVPPKNEKALADAVIELLGDAGLRHRMGENGRKKIMEEFNVEIQMKKQVMLWQKKIK